ncbi:hypothetical protein SLA2020_341740 [Shorea laevis]
MKTTISNLNSRPIDSTQSLATSLLVGGLCPKISMKSSSTSLLDFTSENFALPLYHHHRVPLSPMLSDFIISFLKGEKLVPLFTFLSSILKFSQEEENAFSLLVEEDKSPEI